MVGRVGVLEAGVARIALIQQLLSAGNNVFLLAIHRYSLLYTTATGGLYPTDTILPA